MRVALHRPVAGQGAGREGREPDSCRGSTGSRPSWPRPAIPRSPTTEEREELGGTHFKVHLDGYDQTRPCSPARGRRSVTRSSTSPRGRSARYAIDDYKYRFIDQPNGWLGGDGQGRLAVHHQYPPRPFERTGLAGSLNYYNFFVHEFWRFTFAQQEVAKVGETFIEYPPLQKGASFNLEAVKEQILKAIQAQAGK